MQIFLHGRYSTDLHYMCQAWALYVVSCRPEAAKVLTPSKILVSSLPASAARQSLTWAAPFEMPNASAACAAANIRLRPSRRDRAADWYERVGRAKRGRQKRSLKQLPFSSRERFEFFGRQGMAGQWRSPWRGGPRIRTAPHFCSDWTPIFGR
jgi:hypothetical protein